MKKVILIVLGAALLQSCMKDIARVDTEGTVKVQDLKVPASFDWETIKNVTCVVNTGQVSTLVKLFADKECKEDSIVTIDARAGVDNKIMTSVPDGLETVYALYTSASGHEKIASANIVGDTFSFKISDAQTTKATTRAPDQTNPPLAQNGGITGYPGSFGSVFFEDLYPSLGDYDFNDIVLSYQITLEHPWVSGEPGHYDLEKVARMRIHLKASALGGTIPFTPCVRVVGLSAENVSIPDNRYGDVKQPNPWIYENTKEGIKVSKVSSPLTSDAIFEFKNLAGTNPNKPQGATYFNTQKEFPIIKKIANVVVYLNLGKEMLTEELLDDKIDIFLASPDKTKEIHLRGYESVFSKYDYSSNPNLSSSVPYASKNNLVWAIKTPSIVPHLVERINFCEGYLDFASWAESGGALNPNWYKGKVNSGNLLKYW